MAKAGDYLESIGALSWLEQHDGKERTISDSSEVLIGPAEGLSLVRELYAAGAVEVLVLEVGIGYDHEDANKILVMLPENPEMRVALFAIEARALREMGSVFDPEGERGQKSFMLGW